MEVIITYHWMVFGLRFVCCHLYYYESKGKSQSCVITNGIFCLFLTNLFPICCKEQLAKIKQTVIETMNSKACCFLFLLF